jgi:acyl-CoA synthetase (AMP-forming)/AMP-acid ligase II
MNLLTLLNMVADGHGDRISIGTRAAGITGSRLQTAAWAGAEHVRRSGARTVVFHGENGASFPVALFAASAAGIPFLPLNYRLSAQQTNDIVSAQDAPFVITDDVTVAGLPGLVGSIDRQGWLDLTLNNDDAPEPETEPSADDIAIVLMTSGTTAAPKSAVLRHRHLVSYILGSVEFGGAEADEAMIVSAPPYHIAAVANLLSNLYSGRRIVYLDKFTAAGWLATVEQERITHAMVVPTMLTRIVDQLRESGASAPGSLAHISYGGARTSPATLAAALELFPGADFVNGYGLTETSSTIAVLGPQDHRDAVSSSDPAVRARLGSVGRPLPSVTVEVRDDSGTLCAAGEIGQIYVRGPQVAGEYREGGSVTDADGWFATRDEGYLDEDGFLYVRGRADDTIIRGGENVAPAEIEQAVLTLAGVEQVAVVGVADEEWGQRIAAFVVLTSGSMLGSQDIRDHVRALLRSAKTPDLVVFMAELPHNEAGKIVKRELLASLPAKVS